MKRGMTLIELMVAVSVLGIASYLAGDAAQWLRRSSIEVAQREKALQCLEFEAAALLKNAPPDPQVRAKLLAELPNPMLESRIQGGATVLSVSWQAAGRQRVSRQLAVLAGKAR